MKRIIGFAVLLSMIGCTGGNKNKVVLHLIGSLNRHFVVERLGFNGEKNVAVDSGRGRAPRDSFLFELPFSEPTAYLIRFQNKSLQLAFVHDSSDVDIFYNFTTGEYHFTHSPASTEWKDFQTAQRALGRQETLLGKNADSNHRQLDSLLQISYTCNFNFADTVSNPALFMLAYNLVDYGGDYKGLQRFMQKVAKRFPNHNGVQTLVKNTLDYVAVFSSPLRLGDTLPRLTMPDTNGREILIGPTPGKYTLIDFWSTWCERCRIFSGAKKEARRRLDTNRLAIISVAIDGEKKAWRSVIQYEGYSWPQLIDEKMWAGPVARTLRFDSIPFNFLLGPDGRIIAKGIPPDSLLQILKKAIK
jgi:thiol-disulfide isomerase/thioredoxin